MAAFPTMEEEHRAEFVGPALDRCDFLELNAIKWENQAKDS
jgi:hypothetical protein